MLEKARERVNKRRKRLDFLIVAVIPDPLKQQGAISIHHNSI